MASTFRFMVTVEVERTEGKFASRDELYENIETALMDANPSEVYGIGSDGTSNYEITMWEVEETK
jgi:hypothetical protein